MSVIAVTSLCNAMSKSSKWTLESMRSLLSNTESQNCIICKQLNLYSNEDNLGIICLNDDESYHVGINRYDDYGNLEGIYNFEVEVDVKSDGEVIIDMPYVTEQ